MELNENQKYAAEFNGRHLLVLAGAGTGKTKTIIARATYLISCGVDPSKIQILTFTKRSAAEIVSRVKAGFDPHQAKNLNGSTFHSWCNQLIHRFPDLFGTSRCTILDEDDRLSIFKIACGKNTLHFKDIKLKPQSLLDLYSFGRNTRRNLTDTIKVKLLISLSDEEKLIRLNEMKPKIETILRDYESKKREKKYLDYDDLLQVVSAKLSRDDNAKQIISGHYEHLLIDEMQDTNPLQWELIRPFQDICSLFCVGDDAQSIYSFRGADFKNIHTFKERVSDAEVCYLNENYRSTQKILDLSNWLLERSPLNYQKKLHAVRAGGTLPVLYNFENEWEEALFIAEKISDNYTARDKQYGDHLILSKTLLYTRVLEGVFIEKRIPFVTYGGRGFMEQAHIKDMFALFRVINNSYDELAWMRFLTFFSGIGEVKANNYLTNLLTFENIEECIDWFEGIHDESGTKIYDILRSVFVYKGNVASAIATATEKMSDSFLQKYPDDWEKKRKADFPVLQVLGESYANLSEFVTECVIDNTPLLNRSKIKPSPEDNDRVIISTVHSAKGLESDICFVINVSTGVYPSSYSVGDMDAVEEERRTLYVALTRAKNELCVTRYTQSLYTENYRGGKSEISEGYFLNSLPDELAIQATVKKKRESAKNDFYSEPEGCGMDFS